MTDAHSDVGPLIVADPATGTPTMKVLAKVFSALFPKLVLDTIKTSQIATDKQVCWRYGQDKLNDHEGVRARMGMYVYIYVHVPCSIFNRDILLYTHVIQCMIYRHFSRRRVGMNMHAMIYSCVHAFLDQCTASHI